MNLIRLMLHPDSSHQRLVVMRDHVTGQDIGEPKHLGVKEAFEIDLGAYPYDVDIVIMRGDPTEAAADGATVEDDEALDNAEGFKPAADDAPAGDQPVTLAPPAPEDGSAQETGAKTAEQVIAESQEAIAAEEDQETDLAGTSATTEQDPAEEAEAVAEDEALAGGEPVVAEAEEEPEEVDETAATVKVDAFDEFPEDPTTWSDEQKAEFAAWYDGLPDETGSDHPTAYVLGVGAGVAFKALRDEAAAA